MNSLKRTFLHSNQVVELYREGLSKSPFASNKQLMAYAEAKAPDGFRVPINHALIAEARRDMGISKTAHQCELNETEFLEMCEIYGLLHNVPARPWPVFWTIRAPASKRFPPASPTPPTVISHPDWMDGLLDLNPPPRLEAPVYWWELLGELHSILKKLAAEGTEIDEVIYRKGTVEKIEYTTTKPQKGTWPNVS